MNEPGALKFIIDWIWVPMIAALGFTHKRIGKLEDRHDISVRDAAQKSRDGDKELWNAISKLQDQNMHMLQMVATKSDLTQVETRLTALIKGNAG